MRWLYQVRAAQPERSPSRVLQVLETQRVLPLRFEAWQCHDAMHLRFLVDTHEDEAFRIGWLLRRLPVITSAYWLPVEHTEDEEQLWHRTALAAKAPTESGVDLDTQSDWWHAAPSVTLLADNEGLRLPRHETEVRLRWTQSNLYLLFLCNYEHLSLAPCGPVLSALTQNLWQHDVAEVFLGTDRTPFQQYMEFEVSPRGEWIDLDITAADGSVSSRQPLHSGFFVAASIDIERKRWTAFLRIPLSGLQSGGDDLRLNLFRSQGPGPVELAWQPTHQDSFHVPERMGYLRLIEG